MSANPQTANVSKGMLYAGWVVSALPALMLLFSGGMKLIRPEGMKEQFDHLGWDFNLAVSLGVVEVLCTVLYLYPRTCVLGAVLLTGYMGGAIATHVRIGEMFFIQLGLGILVWLGLYLRDPRIRALMPFRS